MRELWIGMMLVAYLPAAQLDSNTVTVIATRTVSLQPDQVLLSVQLTAPPTAGLDDVLAQLKGSGITAANFVQVFADQIHFDGSALGTWTNLRWDFFVPVAFSKMKGTIAVLRGLQTAIGSIEDSPALTFYVTGTQYSAEAQAAQPCPLPALISDARRQADSMAAAAGMKTGAIVAVSDGTSVDGTGSYAPPGIYYLEAPQGLPPGAPFGPNTSPSSPMISSSPQPACSLTVQFKLTP